MKLRPSTSLARLQICNLKLLLLNSFDSLPFPSQKDKKHLHLSFKKWEDEFPLVHYLRLEGWEWYQNGSQSWVLSSMAVCWCGPVCGDCLPPPGDGNTSQVHTLSHVCICLASVLWPLHFFVAPTSVNTTWCSHGVYVHIHVSMAQYTMHCLILERNISRKL